MTRVREMKGLGLRAHYKVRLVTRGGALLHLATEREPNVCWAQDDVSAALKDAGLIEDYRYGDTLGFIDDDAVSALTWRYVPASPQDGDTP